MSKRCTRCHVDRPLTAFGPARRHADGLRYECNPCRAAAARALPKDHPSKKRRNAKLRARPKDDPHRLQENAKSLAKYHANPAPRNARNRRRKYETKYGITPEDKDRLLAEQGGVCAICKTDKWTASGPSVDHCHATGLVRGILCNRCNAGIGFMGDDCDRMLAAIEYLRPRPLPEVQP